MTIWSISTTPEALDTNAPSAESLPGRMTSKESLMRSRPHAQKGRRVVVMMVGILVLVMFINVVVCYIVSINVKL